MTANASHNIGQIKTSLWDAADQLRANSNLTATEYSMPVLGVIFLRHDNIEAIYKKLSERRDTADVSELLKEQA